MNSIFELLDDSKNGGEIDQDSLINGEEQKIFNYPQGKYQLFRVGDTAASRYIHSVIHDSLRWCKDL